MKIFSAALGLVHGLAILPLAWFVAYAVRNDMVKRYPNLGFFGSAFLPAGIFILWLIMSYSLADMVLDLFSNSKTSRAELGKVWVRALPIGLFIFGLSMALLNRFHRIRKRKSSS